MLADSSIRQQLKRGYLVIDPLPADHQFQPASVDLRLGDEFLSPYAASEDDLVVQDAYLLGPGECVLATTMERVQIPDDIVGRVEGKSSWGRKFLLCHSTAGFVDPGFCGTITLELCNLSSVSQVLKAGVLICQISFQWVDVAVARPYGSGDLGNHYQDQLGVTPTAEPWT